MGCICIRLLSEVASMYHSISSDCNGLWHIELSHSTEIVAYKSIIKLGVHDMQQASRKAEPGDQ